MDDQLIAEFFARHAPHLVGRLTEQTLLIDEGLLDSVLLITFVAFVEERYGRRFPDDQIVPENFRTLGAVRAVLERIRPAAGTLEALSGRFDV